MKLKRNLFQIFKKKILPPYSIIILVEVNAFITQDSVYKEEAQGPHRLPEQQFPLPL